MRQMISFDYYYGMQADAYSFYRIPKVLFTNEYFKPLSCEAKVLYGLMLDRMGLSIKNRWLDEEDKVYIIFTVEEVMELLGCGNKKVIRLLDELDNKKGVGLIERKRIGLGKANVIYVKNFVLQEYPGETERIEHENTGVSEEQQLENPLNTQKCQNDISRSVNTILQEVSTPEMSEEHFKKCQNDISGSVKTTSQEVSKGHGNNTDYNNTEWSNTESYQSISERQSEESREIDEMDKRAAYRRIIMKNIEYDALCNDYNPETVNEILELMLDTVCSRKTELFVNGEAMPIEVVKSRLLKLNFSHIQYVIGCMERNTTQVRNIRQYMLTTLYNAPATISHYYAAAVQHDLYGT